MQESNLPKIPGRPEITALVDYQGFCGFSTSTAATNDPPAANKTPLDESDGEEGEKEEEQKREGFQRVSPQEVVARMEQGWVPFVLDVRWVWVDS